MEEKKFIFSVIIPIYNVEEYLEETIQSVICQDIGFEKNIQMILVNDGSTDNSEEICLRYQDQYPDNVLYVKQENGGVSAARNHGMKYVRGKYVNFLDSDDKWSADAFTNVFAFFEKNYNEIDLVACKQRFFEGQRGLHPLSKNKYKKGSRVIDIFDEFKELQLHITASFLKAEIINSEQFDERLKYGEDALYVNKIILKKHKYGVVSEPVHYYRKRKNQSSALQGKSRSLHWYLVTPELFYNELIKFSYKNYGGVIPYVQYLLMYEMQWRLQDKVDVVLDADQQKGYYAVIRSILNECSDDIIVMPERIYVEQKIFLFCLKYGRNVIPDLKYVKQKLYFNNVLIYDMQKTGMFRIDILEVRSGKLYLSGRVSTPFTDEIQFWFCDNAGNHYDICLQDTTYQEKRIWGHLLVPTKKYELYLPLEGISYYVLKAQYKNIYPIDIKMIKGKFSKFHNELVNSYYVQGGYVITCYRNRFFAYTHTRALERECERKLQREMRQKMQLPSTSNKEKKMLNSGLKYRMLYRTTKFLEKKKIWLISDRINFAGDNGEAFYRYMVKHKTPDMEVYFVISSESEDFDRMKSIGKVVPYKSVKHKLLTLHADKIISSQGEDNLTNPLGKAKKYLGDLYRFKFVFLQHGIIQNTLEIWLNKFNKNLGLFVTSAYPEYRSILEEDYNYDESVVKLTGLPRFDSLCQNVPIKKQIIFLPTWRANLAGEMNEKTGVRPYNPEFKNSTYYKFYQALINDKRLIDSLKKYGYIGKFCVHANNIANAKDFNGNDVISVSSDTINYQKEFKENALLVTDYSSVAFDFAYLRKPVIYTQSDRDTFFAGQVYDEGYWDYDTMGFGPVCKDYDSTVNEIIKQVERNCALEEQYVERIEKFYYKFDQDNCKRVYETICELE